MFNSWKFVFIKTILICVRTVSTYFFIVTFLQIYVAKVRIFLNKFYLCGINQIL